MGLEAFEEDRGGGKVYEGERSGGEPLVVPGEATVASDPSVGSLHDPATFLDDEPFLVWRSSYDFDLDRRGPRYAFAAIGGVGPNAFDEGPAGARGAQQMRRGFRIVHVGGRDTGVKQPSARVNEDVALQSHDFL